MMIGQLLKITLLYDFYGALLTERQRLCVERHYFDDLSLGEIAVELAVSRQAVHDIVKRSVDSLADIENKLGFVARYQKEQDLLREAGALLEQARAEGHASPAWAAVRDKIDSLIFKGGE